MNQKPAGKLLKFIYKSFSVGPMDEWKEKDYKRLLAKTASHETYAETVPGAGLPDVDTLHLRIKKKDIQELHQSFLDSVGLPGVKGSGILMLDPTHEPFYGETKTEWIHEYRPEDGSRGSWKYLSASVLAERRYFVDSKILNQFSRKDKEVGTMLDWTQEMLDIDAVLLDRGLTDSKVLKELKERGLNYLGLCPKYKTVKAVIQEAEEKDRVFLRKEFELNGVETNLVARKDPDKGYWWTWVTNLKLSEGSEYIRLYRKRWNIETGFRVHDEARIKSKSVKPQVRYFYFLASLLLYNGWKALEVQVQFKRCLILLGDGEALVESAEGCGASVDGVEKSDSIH